MMLRRLFAIMRTWRVRSREHQDRTRRRLHFHGAGRDFVIRRAAPEDRRQVSDVAECPVSEIFAQHGFSTFDREKHWRAVMLNVSNLSKLDLSAIDIRTMTPAEREAVIREAMRRARAERAAVMRDLIKRLWLLLGKIAGSGATAWSRPPRRRVQERI
jgi:hypothetical protein